MAAILVAWVVLVATGIGQEFPNDYAAFYAVARALRTLGFGISSEMYSVHFQYQIESFIRGRAGTTLAIPFVNPPVAAWVMLPFSLLPLRAAYLAWDAVALAACAGGLIWLGRLRPKVGGLGLLALAVVSSYPAYLTLGQGQFDMIWPLGAALLASSLEYRQSIQYVPRAAVNALVVAIKPDLFIAMVVPVIAGWRRPQVRALVLSLVVLGAATAFILGPNGISQAAHIELYTIARRFPPTQDMTVTGFFWRMLGPGRAAAWLGLAGIPIGLAILGWAWWRNPPRSDLDWWLALTATTCVSLLIAPHDLVQGMLLLGAPAILVGKALRQAGRGLGPLAMWILAFDLVTLVDMSPHLHLPVRLTPILLLAAALSSWHARKWLALPNAEVSPLSAHAQNVLE
jgi:hypothetical protein